MSSSSTAAAVPTDVPRPPASPKLKSSCDVCSASKVRCERQKPTCSRCLKLGYPCLYSAARRVGRRHGSKRAASGQPSAPRQVPRTLLGLPPETTMLSPAQALAPGNAQSVSPSCTEANLPTQMNTTFGNSQNSNGGSPLTVAERQAQSPSHQLAGGCGQPSNNSLANIDKHEPECMGDGSKVTDCGVVTMLLQEQMGVVYQNLYSTATQPREQFMGSVDAAMVSISYALDRLSTVLICPCSEKLDICLMVGAASMSIMDAYGLIIQASARSSPPDCWSPHTTGQSLGGRSRNTSITEGKVFEDDDSQQWDMSSVSSRTPERSKRTASLMDLDHDEHKEVNATLVRIFEGLPKLAGVTLQFTRRSQITNDFNSVAAVSEVAYALASYTRTKLQTLKNEVTGQLVYRK